MTVLYAFLMYNSISIMSHRKAKTNFVCNIIQYESCIKFIPKIAPQPTEYIPKIFPHNSTYKK